MSEAQDTRSDAAKDAVEDRGKRRANPKISLPRVLALLRPYRWQLIAAAILLVITDGLGLLYPLVIRSLLNTILSHHNAGLLNLVVVFLLIVFVLQAVFGALQSYLVTSFGERLSFDLRTLLFRHLQRLSLSFFDSRRTGELMSRVTNDVTLLQGSLTNNVLPIVSQVVTLVGSVLIAVLINWRITLVIVVVAPIAAIVTERLGRVIRKRTRGVSGFSRIVSQQKGASHLILVAHRVGICSTTKTDAGKWAGNACTSVLSASTPPAEAPITIISCPDKASSRQDDYQ
jgi:ABC-type multidrug transport system fused ATPase/permease subunit